MSDAPDLPSVGATMHRTTARVLPVDGSDRVLLLHGWDPDRPDSPYWFTIGGAVEDDEPLADAAVRELAEETGIRVDAAALGQPVLVNTIEFDWAGRHLVQGQTFFVVRVDIADVTFEGHDAWERVTIDDHRWWYPDDLAADGTAAHPEIIEAMRQAQATVAAMTDIEPPRPAPDQYRDRVPDTGGERFLLEAMLDFHRGTLRWKCAGLTPEQLVTRGLPTTSLTLVGLARHLAENEQWWFRRQAAHLDLEDIYCSEEFPDGEFDLVDPAAAYDDLARLDAEIEASREAVAHLDLDHEFPGPGKGVPMNLRFVYLHMIEEYARHNGHADLLREVIDGLIGE